MYRAYSSLISEIKDMLLNYLIPFLEVLVTIDNNIDNVNIASD